MNINEIKKIIPNNEPTTCESCHKENLRAWTNSNSLEKKLTKIGDVESLGSYGYETYVKVGENPFSYEATAALSYYPYNGSSIYRCSTCKGIIFIYLETAGHGARYQARWISANVKLKP